MTPAAGRARPGDTLPGRALLEALHAAAVAAVRPGPAVAAAVRALDLPPRGAVHLLAVGKAAGAMAEAAVAALAERGAAPAGGVVVAHHPAAPPAPGVRHLVGDHPLPGEGSARAAEALAAAAARVGPDDLAVVLLSGGASSLVGAPDPGSGLTAADLRALHAALLAAGVPIGLTNAVRKRASRWGAGRLAVALAPARVHCLAVSDVPGDDPAVLGSGPCVGDPWDAGALRAALAAAGVLDRLPAGARWLVAAGAPETPKPGDPRLAHATTRVLLGNADAVRGAVDVAHARGLAAVAHPEPLAGEAAPLGAQLVERLLALPAADVPTLHAWGGEPTVTLPADAAGAPGGRLQELALAAAETLAARRAGHLTLLAGSTDGRDGPTDAAGAVVDAGTWDAIRAAGRDPAADLQAHRSHAALGAAGALLAGAPTGTNVADLVLALVMPTTHVPGND